MEKETQKEKHRYLQYKKTNTLEQKQKTSRKVTNRVKNSQKKTKNEN